MMANKLPNARDIMQRKVVQVYATATLAEAARLMLDHGINSLPVLDESDRVVGMIGIRDVLRVPRPSGSETPILKWDRLDEKAKSLRTTSVKEVMARRVVAVDESASVVDVAALMANRGLHPIPVMRGEELLGVVGRADVVRVLLDLGSPVGQPEVAGRGGA
jgi:CBS domain-containing protein